MSQDRQSAVHDEATSLLHSADSQQSRYSSIQHLSQHDSVRQGNHSQTLRSRALSRRNSYVRPARSIVNDSQAASAQGDTPIRSSVLDKRAWYDQFTSTDWIRDAIADAQRVKELRSRRDWRGRLLAAFDGAQGWVLVAIVGVLTAIVAYIIDIAEATIFDYKTGYCTENWLYNKQRCCNKASACEQWTRWSSILHGNEHIDPWLDYIAYISWVVCLALIAGLITLSTRTNVSNHVTLSTFDENLGAEQYHQRKDELDQDDILDNDPRKHFVTITTAPTKTYYPAAGSGVAEVKVILSGFVLHGYLGASTLLAKGVGLIMSVASGLSIGKEGPYVHIATCIGNVTSRIFPKYNLNDAKRREVLSASAAAGVAVAFGAPIGGVLFSLEEVSYYFPPKTLFRTFCCCIVAALSLKFLNPYDTNKIVLFQVRYLTDWRFFEIIIFALLGAIGGAVGASFIKASRFWAKSFRHIRIIKKQPLLEVFLVALATGIISFWNRYTRLPVAELLYELAAPCDAFTASPGSLCATTERIPAVIRYLSLALLAKTALTVIAFGIKVPAGIYVPSMVIGGLFGRMVGHTVQYLVLTKPALASFLSCPANGHPEACVVPGVYALVAAGATMCGVTRLSVTLAVILFELTGSLEHVLPFSLGVLIAKWTADAIEPDSIYDLLMSAYPFLDSKARPVFNAELADIITTPRRDNYIDISDSPWVSATELRSRVQQLHLSGELDGGFPIVHDTVLRGFIPAPDLEFALDSLELENEILCYMDSHVSYENIMQQYCSDLGTHVTMGSGPHPCRIDFTPYIDPAPVALDLYSPLDLVFECFVKLGLRFVCVTLDGRYAGMVHKKAFVKHVKDVQQDSRRRWHWLR